MKLTGRGWWRLQIGGEPRTAPSTYAGCCQESMWSCGSALGVRVASVPDWPNEEFMTVAEVAALLKLNQQTIRNWIDQGSLPALRLGRRVRVLRSDLDRLIEAGSRSSTGLRRGEESEPPADGFWDDAAAQR
jgi:excisionase family DNA binding protein